MNTNMQQKMSAVWEVRKDEAWNAWDKLCPRPCPFPSDDEKIGFSVGFTACHDLLMPLLIEAMPHVMASHGAEHMLDGFRPQRRPIDGLVERLREVME